MALTYEEIGIDGPTASPKSDLRVPATWDQFVDPAAQTGQSIVFFFLIKVGCSRVSFIICPMKLSPNHSS